MKHLLTIAPLALFLTLGPAAPALADTASDCAQMAADEAVPEEDLEDFIAECIAVVEADSPDEAARALQQRAD